MRILAAALLLLAAAPGRAAEVLDWAACRAEAARRNPALMAAEESLRRARARRLGSWSDFLPQLSANAAYSRSDPSATSTSAGLSARQNLFAGLRDVAGVLASRADLDSAEAALAAAAAGVSADLKSAFARLLYAQRQTAVAQGIAARRSENVRLVELRYSAGREHKGSYLRSKAAHRQAVFEVSSSRRALRVAQRELAKALGRSELEVLVASGTLAAEPPSDPPDFGRVAAAVPALRQAEASARAAAAGVHAARAGLLPEVSAAGSLSRGGADWPPDKDHWSASLSLSYPFFPGGRNLTELAAAGAEARRASAELQGTRDEVLLRLEDSFAAYQDSAERTEVQAEFLAAAELRAEIARTQYTSGLLTFENWDIIEDDLISRQKSHLASLRDAVLAQAQWERVQGRGSLE